MIGTMAQAAMLMLAAPAITAVDDRAGEPLLLAGATRIDITPTDLHDLNPFGGGDFIKVHDPIYARILYLQSGAEKVALIGLDLPEVGDMRAFLAQAASQTGVAEDHIMMIATHDHSAPRLGDVSAGTAAQRAGAPSLAYSQALYPRLIAAIKAARDAAVPTRLAVGAGQVDVNVNRDEYRPDKGWGLGFAPLRDSDKTVWVTRLTAMDGKPVATLFNYAVHSTVTFGLKHITGDLAGAAERYVEDQAGGVAIFTMGAAGDQAPRVAFAPQDGQKAEDVARAFQAVEAQGVMLGAEVLRVASRSPAAATPVRIRASQKDVTCPTKAGSGAMASMTSVNAPQVTIRLSALQLGDVAYTGVGGEVTTPIYRHFQRETPLGRSVFMTNVNDRIGYMADDASYDTPIFEVKGSPVARGCAEQAIVQGLNALIHQNMKP